MTDKQIKAEHDRKRVKRMLEILNVEPTEELLTERLEEVAGKKLARRGAAIFALRSEIGSFQGIADLQGGGGLSDKEIAVLLEALNRPAFEFESETLHSVYWAHGSDLTIEQPEAFGMIERRQSGIRVSGHQLVPGDLRPVVPPFSWTRISIPAPSFADGSQFYVGSVLFNFEGSVSPLGPQGQPIVTPYDIEVWDGHVRIATARVSYLPNSSNRYLRIPVESSQKVRWGLSVSFSLHVVWNYGWIDIGSVGVELVNRTGFVMGS